MISYQSTRGAAPDLNFSDVLLSGLAVDGGLYCPAKIPELPDLADAKNYVEYAQLITWPFVDGTIDQSAYFQLVADAYARFRHDEICPILRLEDNHYLLDLTLGPTLAFKDVALQLVGKLLDYELGRRGTHVTVLGATSGDTGSAAIEALANLGAVKVVILHPHGRVSEIQRRQMTTVTAENVRNVAIDGTFDDCQDLVKAAFKDPDIRSRHGLAAVNSINWARVMAQIVYYVWAAKQVAGEGPVSFAVPTGNFGNILAAWYAKAMGLNVDQLIVASNQNDILTRFFETGVLEKETVIPSYSPSMDIQISSNFERLLWEVSGRDAAAVVELLDTFRSTGTATLPVDWVTKIRSEFDGGRLDDAGTLTEMAGLKQRTGVVVDPHTAVGTAVGRALVTDESTPLVSVATASPAKFPDAVESAVGLRPVLPDHLTDLLGRDEHFVIAPNELGAVLRHLVWD